VIEGAGVGGEEPERSGQPVFEAALSRHALRLLDPTFKSQEGAQGQAEGEHAPRGQLHVGCAFPLTCAEIGCCPYLSGSVSPKLM